MRIVVLLHQENAVVIEWLHRLTIIRKLNFDCIIKNKNRICTLPDGYLQDKIVRDDPTLRTSKPMSATSSQKPKLGVKT